MTNTRLPKKWAGLTGDEFLSALDGDEGNQILEGLWRAADPQLALQLVRPLAEAGDEVLAGLLADEVPAPRFPDVNVAAQLAASVVEFSPRLNAGKTKALFDRLADPDPMNVYEAHRVQLEQWALTQDGTKADGWALDVLLGNRASVGSPIVVEQARKRRARDDLAVATCTKLTKQLDEVPQIDVWNRAADYIIQVSSGVADEKRDKLLAALIKLMPAFGLEMPNDSFSELVGTHGAKMALRTVEESDYVASPFSIAALEAVDIYGTEADQRRVCGLLFGPANAIWAHSPQTFTCQWDEENWSRVLGWLLDDAWDEPPLVDQSVFDLAPAEIVTPLVELAVRRSSSPDTEFINRAGDHVARRAMPPEPGGEAPEFDLDLIPWGSANDVESAARLAALLAVGFADRRLSLLAEAYVTERINAEQLVWLTACGDCQMLLDVVPVGDKRRALATALIDGDIEAANVAITNTQTARFHLDLAKAAAPALAGPAFAGLAEAWGILTEEEKDAAVALLCEHATVALLTQLDVVVLDTFHKNAARRTLAVEAIGRIVPKGDPVPESVVGLLESARPEQGRAAVEAIAKITPCDVEMVRKIRGLGDRQDISGDAARLAIQRLATEFVDALQAATAMAERAEYLTLIGATGNPTSMGTLVAFVGAEAQYDDPDLRRAAAAAISELASNAVGDVSVEDHEKLLILTDGPAPEPESSARTDLLAAVARISLGEDDALTILYEFIGFTPQRSADVMFGDERGSLVRHLGLYFRESVRGEPGWPGVLEQLDLVAERLARAAYLRFGKSDSIKDQIQSASKGPDLGSLIGSLANSSELHGARAPLEVLHKYRCERTDYAHDGKAPDDDVMASARQMFVEGATVLVEALQAK